MTALWIVGIVLFLLLVIFLSRVGAEMVFGAETGVTLRLGPVRVQVLPRKEKAKKPKKEKPPKKRKEEKFGGKGKRQYLCNRKSETDRWS